MFSSFFQKVSFKKAFSERVAKRYIDSLRGIVAEIDSFEEGMGKLSDADFPLKTAEFKERLKGGESLDDLLPEAFALVREAGKRTLQQRHFGVQLMGGIILHRGAIAEMRTGEGKTLVATLPAYLNALTGEGVHVVTVNDYLARRDAAWMGQVYAYLGLSVGIINTDGSYVYDPAHREMDEERDEVGSFKVVYEFLRPASKKDAYAADITYGTNNEFGFDYLRDNTAYEKSHVFQRSHPYAIVDEIDSILIDEARTPLIISMPFAESEDLYGTFATIARSLVPGEDYTIDEKQRSTALSDKGIEKAEKALGVDNIYTDKGIKYVHHLETAVRAKALFTKDKHYVVREGEVVIVDEFTGRLQPGRRWSEGLHQAIEAKEGARIQQESRTLASVTFQNFFRLYKKLGGMTGTALTSAEEFYTVYGLETIPVPTNRSNARIDRDDFIFQSERGKMKAVAKKVQELHEKGQPVLVGTVSIEDNEKLSQYLAEEKIPHEMLNAKNHEREGAIIAEAGKRGAVTLATNMAGRGVDIKLGGPQASPEEAGEVRNLGGLFVLGTERHEARRIDNQLRGRSGRQGDPGETQFFVSLEDQLMRVFAAETVKNVMGRLGIAEDEPIANRLITRSLEAAQTRIEGFNFDARKHVLAYDDVLNLQRKSIYERRMKLLVGDEVAVRSVLAEEIEGMSLDTVVQDKEKELGSEAFIQAVRRLMLQSIDGFWIQHLEMMEYLRGSVNLRSYGQRDPLVEYRKEGLKLFRELEESIQRHIADAIPRIVPDAFKKEEIRLKAERANIVTAGGGKEAASSNTQSRRVFKKYERNDVVTITDGTTEQTLKYKKAEPLLQSGWKIKE
jgi:preprotein translocase subunit SecA